MPINKYVNKVGIEIEGNWINLKGCRGPAAISNAGIVHDGSVKFDDRYPKRFWDLCKKNNSSHNPRTLAHIGEVVSPAFNSIETATKWMMDYWPDRTNSTCGLHFHASLNDSSYYSCLMEKEFYLYLKKSLAGFATEEKLNRIFHERFEGKTEWAKKYCRDEFIPLKQAFVTQKLYNDANRSRYTMLNFCHGLHETVEIRVFTAHMPLKRSVNCLLWYVSVITNYLEENYDSFCNAELTKDQLTIELNSEEDKDIFVQKDENLHDDIISDEFELEMNAAE